MNKLPELYQEVEKVLMSDEVKEFVEYYLSQYPDSIPTLSRFIVHGNESTTSDSPFAFLDTFSTTKSVDETCLLMT